MAESDGGTVESEAQPQTHGNRLVGFFKRIKPGEWALIGIGVASLVVFYIWYQNNQNNSSSGASTTPSGGTNTPNYSTAADPGQTDPYEQELIQLLQEALSSGQASVPTTSPTNNGGGGTGHGTSTTGNPINPTPVNLPGGKHLNGVPIINNHPGIPAHPFGDNPPPIDKPVHPSASSGSGISSGKMGSNTAPTSTATETVHEGNLSHARSLDEERR